MYAFLLHLTLWFSMGLAISDMFDQVPAEIQTDLKYIGKFTRRDSRSLVTCAGQCGQDASCEFFTFDDALTVCLTANVGWIGSKRYTGALGKNIIKLSKYHL